MTFALLFLILLSFLLVCGAFLIWKSQLPENDKIVSIISLMGLFCVVAIINEFKRGGNPNPRFAVYDFESNFFAFRDRDENILPKLPALKIQPLTLPSFSDLNLIGNEAFPSIILLEGESKIGKTYALKSLTKELHNRGIPALFFDLRSNDTLDINNIFRSQSLEALEEAIDKYNQNGKIPFIIIDSFDRAFNSENKLSPFMCPVCEVLKEAYDHKRVTVLLTTNQIDLREKLLLNPGFYRRTIFKKFDQHDLATFQQYAVSELNGAISQETRKFTANSAELFYKQLGCNWEIIREYLASNLGTVEEFLEDWLNQKKRLIDSHRGSHDLFGNLLDALYKKETREYTNEWVPIGKLRRTEIRDLSEKLETAVSQNILDFDNGYYRFRSQAIMNAAILSLNKHKLTELIVKK